MLAFTLRRAIQAIGVMIAVGIISFSMFRFAGDPVNQIVSIDTSAAERAEIRKSLGLDDPVPVQFARYFANAAQFKFGVSYQFRLPVADLLKERMPATLELATCATILAMVFGILMGVYSALKRDTLLAKIFQAVSLIGISLPTFLIGILLIYLFAVTLGLAAVVRPRRCRADRLVDHRAAHGLRPQGADHALDHARPVPDDADHAAGAGRDARGAAHRLYPVCAGARIDHARDPFRSRPQEYAGSRHHRRRACSLARLLHLRSSRKPFSSGRAWDCLFVQAVQNVDIPIMAAYLLMVSLIFVTINLVVDILYTVVDPRLRSTIGRPA